MDLVRIRCVMPDGGVEWTDWMPRAVAREIVVFLIPIGLFRWDASARLFGTGLIAGHHVREALIVP